MTAVAKLSDANFRWWCPGCEHFHIVQVVPRDPNGWDYNQDINTPTLHPSVLVYPIKTFIDRDLEGDALIAPENITLSPRCHAFIRDGRIEFLSDSTHALAGQTVDMTPSEEWYR